MKKKLLAMSMTLMMGIAAVVAPIGSALGAAEPAIDSKEGIIKGVEELFQDGNFLAELSGFGISEQEIQNESYLGEELKIYLVANGEVKPMQAYRIIPIMCGSDVVSVVNIVNGDGISQKTDVYYGGNFAAHMSVLYDSGIAEFYVIDKEGEPYYVTDDGIISGGEINKLRIPPLQQLSAEDSEKMNQLLAASDSEKKRSRTHWKKRKYKSKHQNLHKKPS